MCPETWRDLCRLESHSLQDFSQVPPDDAEWPHHHFPKAFLLRKGPMPKPQLQSLGCDRVRSPDPHSALPLPSRHSVTPVDVTFFPSRPDHLAHCTVRPGGFPKKTWLSLPQFQSLRSLSPPHSSFSILRTTGEAGSTWPPEQKM